MRALRPVIVAAIWSLLFGMAVNAQAKEPSAREIEKTRVLLADFGDCVVRRSTPIARAVILNNVRNNVIMRGAGRLIDGQCLSLAGGFQAEFSGDQFRYMLADALVRRDYAVLQDFDFQSLAPLTHFTPDVLDPAVKESKTRKAEKLVTGHVKDEAYAFFSRYGECVVRRAPRKVQALLLTKSSSVEETATFGELSDPLGECLSDGQFKFTRETLRGVLALNFYRLVGAPAGAQVATLKVDN